MAALIGEFAARGPGQHRRRLLRHDAGPHPRHRRGGRGQDAARDSAKSTPQLRLSGLEPFTLTPEIPFVNIGERTNVTGSAQFRKLITAGDYAAALDVAREQVDERRADHRRQHGRGPARFRSRRWSTFLNLIAAEPDIARVPVMIDSSKWTVIEAGLKCVQGKGDRQFDLDEGRRGGLPRARRDRAPLRRRRRGHGLRRAGPGRHARAQDRDLHARLQHPDRTGRLPAGRHHLRSEHLRDRDRHRGAQQLRRRLHRGDALDHGRTCRTPMSPAASRTCRSRSAATSRCARRCTRCSSTTPSRPAWTWASSMPAQLAVYDDHRSGTARSLRGRRPQPPAGCRPSACWRSPSAIKGDGKEAKEADLAWRELPVEQAAGARAGARHHRIHRGRHRGGAASTPTGRST